METVSCVLPSEPRSASTVTPKNASHSSDSERKLMVHLSVCPNVLATVILVMELEELHALGVILATNFKEESVSLTTQHVSPDASFALQVQESKTKHPQHSDKLALIAQAIVKYVMPMAVSHVLKVTTKTPRELASYVRIIALFVPARNHA